MVRKETAMKQTILYKCMAALLAMLMLLCTGGCTVNKKVEEYSVPKAMCATTLIEVAVPDSFADRLSMASMQGLCAKQSEEQILMLAGTLSNYYSYIKEDFGVQVKTEIDGQVPEVSNLARYFSSLFDGYILCSGQPDSESVNAAISLSGVLNGVICTSENEDKMKAAGLTCLLDVTSWTDDTLRKSAYWDKLSRSVAFEQPSSLAMKLVDYAVMCGAYFNFYSGTDESEHTAMYEFLDDGAVIYGYNNTLGEFKTVDSFSKLNLQMIPADHAMNLSVLSGFSLDSVTQKRAEAVETPAQAHTVCFIVSDGDNMQWFINGFAGDNKWYSSDIRGEFNVGWGMPPSAIDTVAPLVRYLYDNQTERDEFIMQLGGMGYTFPSRWDSSARQAMAAQVASYMRRSDLRYMEILDDDGFDAAVLSDFTAQDGIDGIFYIDYHNYAGKYGKIIWTNGKPAVSARYTLWNGKSDNSIETIARMLNRSSTDLTSEDAYSFVIVHAWSGLKDGELVPDGNTMEAIKALVEMLDEDVDVVTPDVFMKRLTENVKH